MNLGDTDSWNSQPASTDAFLSDAEVEQLELLNNEFASQIPRHGSAEDIKKARLSVIAQVRSRLEAAGDPWADVYAHAVAYDHLLHDAKYRVMLDWINQWIERVGDERRMVGFESMSLLGKGGFGAVFKAYDGQRWLAVKLARIATLPSDRHTIQPGTLRWLDFFKEARQHAKINILGCVGLIDAKSGIPERFDVEAVLVHLREKPIWFSMQLIEGPGSLRDLMTTRYQPGKTISIEEAIRLMKGTARILQRLHSESPADGKSQIDAAYFIHKDFKPENILVDRHGQPWITDFGLATARASQRVFGNPMSGTPAYMAPEQFKTDTEANYANAQTDIWSWGVVFYELMTGGVPFTGKTLSDLREQIQKSDVDPPSSKAKIAIPSYVEQTILKCLRRERSGEKARFGSFQQLLAEMNRLRQLEQNSLPLKVTITQVVVFLSVALVAIAILLRWRESLSKPYLPNPVPHPSELSDDLKEQARVSPLTADNDFEKRLESVAEQVRELQRLPADVLDKVQFLKTNGNLEQRRIAATALQRHQSALAIDFMLARDASDDIQFHLPKVLVLGKQDALIPDVRRIANQQRVEVFQYQSHLPKEFLAAHVKMMDERERFLIVALAYFSRYSPVSENIHREALHYVIDSLAGKATLRQDMQEFQEALKAFEDSDRERRRVAVENGARTDWRPLPKVDRVFPGTAVALAGVKKGDLLIRINDQVMERRDPAAVMDLLSGPKTTVQFQTLDGVKSADVWRGETLGCTFDTASCTCPVNLTLFPPMFFGMVGYNTPVFTNLMTDRSLENVSIEIEDLATGVVVQTKIAEITALGSAKPDSIFTPQKTQRITINATGYLPRVLTMSEHLE